MLSIPTLILFRDGAEAKRIVGALPKRRLEAELEPALVPETCDRLRRPPSSSSPLIAVLALAVFRRQRARRDRPLEVGETFFDPTRSLDLGGRQGQVQVGRRTSTTSSSRAAPAAPSTPGSTEQPGFVFKKKFNKAGTYKLICTVHEDMKMKVNVN